MNEILKFISMFLASLGGTTVVIATMFRLASGEIVDALQKKRQLKLDKELEIFKAKLAGKEYVTRAYFDKKIEIYQSVAISMFDMVRDISVMIPTGVERIPADEIEREKEDEDHYRQAHASVARAQDILNQNAPFIDEIVYKTGNRIRKMCCSQLNEYKSRFNALDLGSQKKRFSKEAYNRTHVINETYECFVKMVRDSLKNLEII